MKNIESYIKVIHNKYPELQVKSSRIINDGQNNLILVVNEELIFRFPRNEENRINLKKEYSVLIKLDTYLPLSIPSPQYYLFKEDLQCTFFGYPLVQGLVMKKSVFDLVKNKKLIANQLARFLKTLHSQKVLKEVESILPSSNLKDDWLDLYNRIENRLFYYMRKCAIEDVRSDFDAILAGLNSNTFAYSLVHGDFGPTNIIVNKNLDSISGIIDFGSTHIGDPADDIASLIGPFGYGEDFIMFMVEEYPEIKYYFERAMLYRKTFALQEALYGIENDDKEAFDAGIRDYR